MLLALEIKKNKKLINSYRVTTFSIKNKNPFSLFSKKNKKYPNYNRHDKYI